eukprot:TRINITY_DN2841_c0_g1_i1.p1 TRINITY_DN2841_c0_g1~~TRINITY_DN2841_c0_g1_i1.p1  ORF type:complete len:105 (-),score=33.26 TRINITY_DN2841_c0_g1_i1:127-441(-)
MFTYRHYNEEYTTQLGQADKLVVVDFSAEWCGPCKRIAPTYAKLAETHSNATFLHIDIDEVQDIPVTKDIQGVPTFMFFKNGELITQFAGASVAKLEENVTANL